MREHQPMTSPRDRIGRVVGYEIRIAYDGRENSSSVAVVNANEMESRSLGDANFACGGAPQIHKSWREPILARVMNAGRGRRAGKGLSRKGGAGNDRTER
jgi:hypothetical protein